MAHGNTRFNVSEFNFLKDPTAAHVVFTNVKKLVMVPIEVSRSFNVLSHEHVEKAFTQRTVKGQLVQAAFVIAQQAVKGRYEVTDPCAVIVAFCPELVTEWYERPCFIELEGKFTKGMVVIDWLGRSFEKTWNTTIIGHLELLPVIDLLIESVSD